ncbi:hypothetical protein [Actinoallomurus soli]|uniref:hypothetical protein n=1 Tax=Actinoallomurus soli TaxID=2952535 RepID=UPI002093CDE7|nr:hypothetical protein [Actinoallomurus soli]MCO5967497.1 hypothetical protein [Actinoallomurus soli]
MSMPSHPTPQPPYGGPGFVPPPPQKKPNPVLIGCLGCGGLLVVLIVLGAIVSAVSGDKGQTTATPPVAAPRGPANGSAGPAKKTSPQSSAPSKPSSPPKPHTVLTESGNGMKTTRTFHVHGDWDLHYSFNCANFGGQGNFAVSDDNTGQVFVNSLAATGKDVTHQHDGGSIALSVLSECNWRIKVVQLP